MDGSRSDEVGILATDYFNVICMLHNRNMKKKKQPKHTINAFYLPASQSSPGSIRWSEFYSEIIAKKNPKLVEATKVEVPITSDELTDLDVLGTNSIFICIKSSSELKYCRWNYEVDGTPESERGVELCPCGSESDRPRSGF